MNLILSIFFLNVTIILLLISYPLIIWLRSVFFQKQVLKIEDELQPVSIIIACSNEELFIRQKIDSFLDKDEWIKGSEIIVISNGSKDATNIILSDYSENPNIKIIIEPNQSTKIESVNRGVKESKHELLVFSDCRQVMEKGSVKQLIANFKDPEVGTVSSTLIDSINGPKFSFRSLLNFISQCESLSGSSLNVFGALYAQRKSIFRELPTDLLFDDLFVVVSTLLQKKRLICEKKAIIYDVSFEQYYQENRIQRLARGLLIFLFNYHGMIRQLPFSTFMRFIIFKYLKLILPFVSVFLCLDFFCLFYFENLTHYILLLSITITSVCVFEPARRFLFHLIKINYNFMVATIQFIFFNNRSNKWDKLRISKII